MNDNQKRILDYVEKVAVVYNAMSEVAGHALGPVGIKGICSNFVQCSLVPEWVIYAHFAKETEKYINGWCTCGKRDCADPEHDAF